MNTSRFFKAHLSALLAAGFAIGLFELKAFAMEPDGNRSKAVAALEDLEKRTGKAADELLPAIELYASMVEMLAEDLQSGAVTKEQLTDVKVITKNLMAGVNQDSSMDATTKLIALRSINGGEVEGLKKYLRKGIVSHYTTILNRDNELAKAYRMAVDKEAAKDEELASALLTAKAEIERVKQGGAEKPAIRPESNSERSDKPQPESDGRTR